jgi:hypothetical protein
MGMGQSRLSLIQTLGYAAVFLLVIVIVLQLLLVVGVLPISMAWGGSHTELTPALKGSSLVAVLLLLGFAYVMARRSGILGSLPPSTLIRFLAWLVAVYLVFNTMMNFLSPIPAEKWVFGPISLILVGLTVTINFLNRPIQGK